MAKQFGWIGQGPIYFGDFDLTNGDPNVGYLDNIVKVGCANSKLTINFTGDTLSLKETCSGKRATLYEVDLGNEVEVALDMQQFSSDELALAFQALQTAVTGASVTGEAKGDVLANQMIFTQHPKISAVTVYAGGTPLVQGTDYEIESAEHGAIKMLTAQTAVTVDYTYADYNNLALLKADKVEKGLIYNGSNSMGDFARVIVPRIQWRVDGDFNWISEDFATLSLKGKALYVDELSANNMFGGFAKVDALSV